MCIRDSLSGATFPNKGKCEGFNFSGTLFKGSNFHQWSFVDCDFTECDLTNIAAQGSYWRNAIFRGAKISGDLVVARFYIADFTGATVKNCGLPGAELRFVRLNGTTFWPYLGDTDINSWSVINSDLSGLQNPTSGCHEYPSNVDIASLQKTAAGLVENKQTPEGLSTFFEECGLPREILDVFATWSSFSKAVDQEQTAEDNYYSCFISYSSRDDKFAKRIHGELTARGVHCWMDSHEMVPGANIFDEIDRGIHQWDKVLLCCSSNSLESPWVDRELDKALQKEEALWRERGKKTLVVIPLNIDDYLFEWNGAKASALTSRVAADFTNWDTAKSKFAKQIENVLKALDTDRLATRFEPPPKI